MLHITSQNKEALESEVKFVLGLFAIKPKSSKKQRSTKAGISNSLSDSDDDKGPLVVATPKAKAKDKSFPLPAAVATSVADLDLSEPSESFNPAIHKQPVGQKVSLQQVGDSLTAQFVSVGSAYVKKAGRHCVVMQMKIDGEDSWLLGSTLTESVNASGAKPGDMIRVTKTKQFKKAADRSHAAAAEFEITKL